jgi:hypothetical protein
MQFTIKLLKLLTDTDLQDIVNIYTIDDISTFCINCSDIFFWGCSDEEEITEDSFHILEQTITEAKDFRRNGYHSLIAELFCARVRGERPQGAAYSYYPRETWPLFDACGPERPIGYGNPYKPGQYPRGPYGDKA